MPAFRQISQHFNTRDFCPSRYPVLLWHSSVFMFVCPLVSSLAQSSCPPLVAPAHGRKFGSKYLVGHEVHFTCSQGYRMIGQGTRVCQENSTWSGVNVVCKGGSKSFKIICIIHVHLNTSKHHYITTKLLIQTVFMSESLNHSKTLNVSEIKQVTYSLRTLIHWFNHLIHSENHSFKNTPSSSK